MSDTFDTAALEDETVWVESMGGPLVVVPLSALDRWDGCTPGGEILGATGRQDDYDRACAVEDYAGVVSLRGNDSISALVLGDEPASTCYLPGRTAFVRWLAADSEAELFAAAQAVLDDPATPWEDCGIWTTDGPAVLMDSAEAGKDLGKPYPHGHGQPSAAPVPVAPGSWRVRAFHTCSDESAWVGIVPGGLGTRPARSAVPRSCPRRPSSIPGGWERDDGPVAAAAGWWLPFGVAEESHRCCGASSVARAADRPQQEDLERHRLAGAGPRPERSSDSSG